MDLSITNATYGKPTANILIGEKLKLRNKSGMTLIISIHHSIRNSS